MSDNYTGKRVVVGLTFEDFDEALVGHAQFHCRIARINAHEGMVLERLDGGPTFNVPPVVDQLEPARLYEYHFKSTGEVVYGPDFELMLTIAVPPEVAEEMRAGTRPLEPAYMLNGFSTTPPAELN